MEAQREQSRLKLITKSEDGDQILSIDVHPNPEKPFILASHSNGNVSISNYDTLENKHTRVTHMVGTDTWNLTHWICSAKFIPTKDWIVAGGGNGYIYVVDPYQGKELKKFKAHGDEDFLNGNKAHGDWVQSLAVHPNQQIVLSAGWDNLIKLWSWDDNCNWTTKRTFRGHEDYLNHVVFNPYDNGETFASASQDCTVKIWNTHDCTKKPKPAATFECDDDKQQHVAYFSMGHGQYIITGSLKGPARVWDLQNTNKPLKKLKGTTPEKGESLGQETEVHGCNTGVINFDDMDPVLVTVSRDFSISFHDATTYKTRSKETGLVHHGPPMDFVYIKSRKSLAIACRGAIAKLDMKEGMNVDNLQKKFRDCHISLIDEDKI